MKHIGKIIKTLIPLSAVFLIVMELVVTNELAGLVQNVEALDSSTSKLQEENDLLTQQVASASALTTISQKAQELGFIQPKANDFIALGQQSVAVDFSPRFETSLLAGQAGEPR